MSGLRSDCFTQSRAIDTTGQDTIYRIGISRHSSLSVSTSKILRISSKLRLRYPNTGSALPRINGTISLIPIPTSQSQFIIKVSLSRVIIQQSFSELHLSLGCGLISAYFLKNLKSLISLLSIALSISSITCSINSSATYFITIGCSVKAIPLSSAILSKSDRLSKDTNVSIKCDGVGGSKKFALNLDKDTSWRSIASQ